MIHGLNFVWGHIGKTGGDATHTLLSLFPDLVLQADALSDPRKHDTFRVRNIVPDSRHFVLNIRRLPCWVISFVNHVKDTHYGYTLPPSSVLSRTRLPDHLIRDYTGDGQFPIRRWLRMENLREDLLDFLHQDVRPITAEEAEQLRAYSTSPPRKYDHDVHRWFTRGEVEQLYALNPLWAAIEQKTYGNLLLEGSWKHPLRKTYRNLKLQADALFLDRLIRTGKRQAIRSARAGLRRALMISP